MVPTTRDLGWLPQVTKDLKRHEGCSLKAYWDDIGRVWTIGYGHTGPDVYRGLIISQEKADEWLREDIMEAYEDAKFLVPNWNSHNAVRKGVLVNMAFNLGRERLGKFKNTLGMIRSHDYSSASVGMLNSLWARQVKGRANELAERMRTGGIKERK